ncbi:MAG: hypothetical protein U9M95_06845 [Candidatus Altiarchaeota archaeon]|nr:hypothetical protein [Candidatus Altiarchaeota archaeon]
MKKTVLTIALMIMISSMANADSMTVVSDSTNQYQYGGTSGWNNAVGCWVHSS